MKKILCFFGFHNIVPCGFNDGIHWELCTRCNLVRQVKPQVVK